MEVTLPSPLSIGERPIRLDDPVGLPYRPISTLLPSKAKP